MHNARQRHIFAQLLKINPHAHRLKTQLFCRIADTQHTHTAAGGGTHIAQFLNGVGFAVVLGYHCQAGGAAVHLVGLAEVGEGV